MKKQKTYFVLTIAVMLLIFIHSAMPADLSSEESGFFVSLITRVIPADPELTTFFIRKTAHFLEYLFLGFCIMQTFRFTRENHNDIQRIKQERITHQNNNERDINRKSNLRQSNNIMCRNLPACNILCAWAIGTAYAVTDEIHQLFVPGRSCELRDICIDAVGVLCGCLIIRLWTHYRTT